VSAPVRWVKGALVFFATGAVLGAGFAVLGPVTSIRVLGLVALACAVAGCALHLAVLWRIDPLACRSLAARLYAPAAAHAVTAANR